MNAESARKFEALETQAQGIMASFTGAGYEAVAPAIIQPAEIFLDVIGEELRGRTYVFTDQEGLGIDLFACARLANHELVGLAVLRGRGGKGGSITG